MVGTRQSCCEEVDDVSVKVKAVSNLCTTQGERADMTITKTGQQGPNRDYS